MAQQTQDAQVLALLGLDGQTVSSLQFIENESAGAVFALPPDWLPGVKRGLAVPYRIQASISPTLPLHLSYVKVLLEWSFRKQGFEDPSKAGWFVVDAQTLSATLNSILLKLSSPAEARQLANSLCSDAIARVVWPDKAALLWAAAQAIWPYTGAQDFERTPAEDACDALLEVFRQTMASRGSEPVEVRNILNTFLDMAQAAGSLSPGLIRCQLQRLVDNKQVASDELQGYLIGLQQAYDRNTVSDVKLERECVRLLQALRRDWAGKDDCPELIERLSLSLREALVSICEKHFDSDLTLLFWAKQQLVHSFFADPTYRKFILAGMALCVIVVAVISIKSAAVMCLLGGAGYAVARRRG